MRLLDFFRRKPKSMLELLNSSPMLREQKELYDAMLLLCEDGVDADEISNGTGEFGLTPNNPVPCKTIMGSASYLSRLLAPDGTNVLHKRLGSVTSAVSAHPIDCYEISHSDGWRIGTIYVSPYQKRNSGRAPRGLLIFDGSDICLSPAKVRTASVDAIWFRAFPIFSDNGLQVLDLVNIKFGWPSEGPNILVATIRLALLEVNADGQKSVVDITEQDVFLGEVPLPSGPSAFCIEYQNAVTTFKVTAVERLNSLELREVNPVDFCLFKYVGPAWPWVND